MRKLQALLFGSWLGPALAFDFEDPNNPVSPAFHFGLATNDDSGFELQREPEPAFDVSDQTPANSSMFATDLMGGMSSWEDGDDGDRDILARQTMKCPTGTYMCPNGRCCRTGQTCVTSGCCPSGNQQCGSRGCYNPGAGETCCGGTGRYCSKGYDCVSNGCCRKGTKPCGSGCYDPKTQVCCGAAGTCPKTSTCVQGGCCPKGMKKCGNSKCYNPNTETCCPANSGLCGRQTGSGACALDTICPKDKTCVGNNGCCPKGQKLCGTKGCYDPKTQVCCNDDEGRSCPKDYDCLKDGCCPKGMIKCGKNKCYDPKTSVCCQDAVQSKNWACRSGFQCCVESEGCFNPKTQRCCADPNGPCDIDGACCAGKCCAAGYKCDKNQKCRKKSPPRKTKTKKCKTPTPTRVAPTPMVTVPFVYDKKRSIRPSADPNSDEVFEISNRAVLLNMCQGMKNLNGGKATQQFKVTYAGKDDKNCWHEKNRKIMCPEGFCAKAVEEFVDQFFPGGIPSWAKGAIEQAGTMSCDEFPPANSLQGGDAVNGVAMCIPAEDNSWQGGTLGNYFKEKLGGQDIEPGEDYIIEIVGWDCGKKKPMRRRGGVEHGAMDMFEDVGPISWSGLVKRDSFDNAVERYGDGMYHGFDAKNPKLNLMAMPLGDLAAGTYLVNLNVTKGNLSYTVVDYVGNNFEATTLSNGSVKFTLDNDWVAVSLTGTTEEEEVELTYQAEALPATTTTQSPTPSETDNSGYLVQPWGAVKVMGLAFAVMFFWN